MMETTFHASIPETASAIRIHGEAGLRLTLDVAETNLPSALALISMRGCDLIVTVRVTEHGSPAIPFDDDLPFMDGNGYPPEADDPLTVAEGEVPL